MVASINAGPLAVVEVDTTPLSQQDISFLKTAQQSNLNELAEANLALQNSTSIETRLFARWMLGDHSAQAAQLTTIGRQIGVPLPTSPNAQTELSQLSGLKNTAFDQAYAQAGVADHTQAVATFRQEANQGTNKEIVGVAQQSTPLLQAHLEQASILANKGDSGPVTFPEPTALPAGAPVKLSAQDQAFVQAAASTNLTEIAEAQTALQKGSVASREFARWMIADHTALNGALKQLSDVEGFALPSNPTQAQQTEIKTLNAAGGNFDTVYAQTEANGHNQAVMQFMQEASSGTDPLLVGLAKAALPILQQHQAGASDLLKTAQGQPLTTPSLLDFITQPLQGTQPTPPPSATAFFSETSHTTPGLMFAHS